MAVEGEGKDFDTKSGNAVGQRCSQYIITRFRKDIDSRKEKDNWFLRLRIFCSINQPPDQNKNYNKL